MRMGVASPFRPLAAAAAVALWVATSSSAFVIEPRAAGGRRFQQKSLYSSSSSSPASSSSPPAADATSANPTTGPIVAKVGGAGVASASEQELARGLTLGAPPDRPQGGHYLTKGGVAVTAHVEALEFSTAADGVAREGTSARAIEDLIDDLDSRKGVLLASSYQVPGRYARWSLGFVDPPLEVTGRADKCTVRALNDRGRVLMPAIEKALNQLKFDGVLEKVDVHRPPNENDNDNNQCSSSAGGAALGVEDTPTRIDATIVPPPAIGTFSEEDRSRQPSLFSVVRALVDLFGYSGDCRQLGLYGGFGYDLTFQFEPIDLVQDRDPGQRDLLLYLPDTILVVDQDKRDAWRVSYDFGYEQRCTQGIARVGSAEPFQPFDEEAAAAAAFSPRDTPQYEFAKSVERAKHEFKVGNLFETVLSQTFREKLDEGTPPSVLFRRLRRRNPAPYGFFINLGEQEYLVGASPEMFVRCEAIRDNDYRPGAFRVETCPISGTVARGADALEDAQNVKRLMMNAKEESELTMCTDVDRNDKSRICEPGSVQVIGRRQIEMYSRLIHTVDHVEGYLRPEYDALDAFLCHTWAVTVTGAPKTWAIQFVERNERSPRCWYGGAVGMVGFDGGLNTGLTLRTVRVKDGVAEVRAGATLLYDSHPPDEELETELKASAMINAIVEKGPEDGIGPPLEEQIATSEPAKVGTGRSVILIDHEDSFVHTLGNYLRQTGATVRTLRSGPSALKTLESLIAKGQKPDLVILSPGPGNPSDFALSTTIDFVTKNRIPAFGVCLGLQGIVEHFGGTLGVLGYPMHGKPSLVSLTRAGKDEESIFSSLPDTFEVARYHSLHGLKENLPSCLEVTALSDDGVVMGIQHKELPLAAVQFHPESILTSPTHGMTILKNVLSCLKYDEEDALADGEVNSFSGAETVGKLESLSLGELRSELASAGLSSTGSKSELVVRLALWTHKMQEAQAGRIDLNSMSIDELQSLTQGLGLQGSAAAKDELVKALETCLYAVR